MLSAAQGESVQAAVVSGSNPIECEVYIDNELAGYYKGRDPGHLERNIRYRLEEIHRKGEVRVVPVPASRAPEADQPDQVEAQAAETAGAPGAAENTQPMPEASESAEPTESPAEASSATEG